MKKEKIISKCVGNRGLLLTLLALILLFSAIDLYSRSVLAQSATNDSSNNAANQDLIKEKQQQIEDLQQKEESYRQMIQLKQDKEQTLQNQINLMDSQISNLEKDVSDLQAKIDATSGDIAQLSDKITKKEEDIGEKRQILANVIQSYYESNQDSLVQLFLSHTNLSEFLSQTDYTSQTGSKIDEVLASIVSDRAALEQAKKDLETKNESQKEQRGAIMEKKHYLDDEQNSKQQLLEKTNGEEQKYQDLLAKVEEEKLQLLGDIGDLSQQKKSELAAVEATLGKPKSGLASTSWYFSQTDSKWGNQGIGFSNSLMKNYGCAVTALAMVLKYHGADINPGILARQPIFYSDLIVWPQQWKGTELSSSTSHGNIDWKIIDTEIKNKNPVIVFVKAVKRGAGHYVVIHGKDKDGNYVVHDPYWGDNIFLSSTRALVSALYGGSTSVDQMIIYH
jgi:peptidoglycan hydrolase CwlO-like protein